MAIDNPDDAPVHLAHVRRLLRPGGAYVLQTPSRITGPHDFSRGFDRTATGLHLKEWCYGSLIRALKAAGYARVYAQLLPRRLAVRSERLRRLGVRRAALKVPIEQTIALVPLRELRTRLGRLLQIDQVVIAAWRGDR